MYEYNVALKCLCRLCVVASVLELEPMTFKLRRQYLVFYL